MLTEDAEYDHHIDATDDDGYGDSARDASNMMAMMTRRMTMVLPISMMMTMASLTP